MLPDPHPGPPPKPKKSIVPKRETPNTYPCQGEGTPTAPSSTSSTREWTTTAWTGLREIGIEAITSAVDEGEQIRVDTVQPIQSYDTARPFDALNVKVHVSQDGSGVPEDRLGITASVHTKLAASNGRNRLGFPTLTDDGDEPDTTVTFTLLERAPNTGSTRTKTA